MSRGRVAAAMNANVWDEGEAIEALLRKDGAVDPTALADPDIGLGELSVGAEM